MKNRFFIGLSPFLQLILLALITVVSFFLFTLIGLIGAVVLYGIPFQDVLSSMNPSNPDNIGLLKFMQITQSFGIFILPSLVVGWLATTNPFNYLGFRSTCTWAGFGIMLLVLLAIEPVVAYSGILNQNMSLPGFMTGLEEWMKDMETRAMELTEAFLNVKTLSGLGVNLLMVAILPALGEELFFRGVLQRILTKWFKNVHVAVIVTSILFSALHMQFYGFIPRFILGMLFGYLYVWSGNLWYPVLAHLVHNTIPVIAYYLYASELSGTSVDDIGTGDNVWMWAIGGSILLIIFAKRFRERFREHKLE
ncbi:MAG: CPBP family intramembrane glutamic endopeptidase [Bacteroidota bacterium]|nr:CPBP family intramembrane glutamic endopeptidase [Bacteroidota bacterium]